MKKTSNILAIILIVFAIGASAFGIKDHAPFKNLDPVLYWFDESGNYTFRQNTQPDEVGPSGCPDSGSNICERGYTADDLIDADHPELGLKSTATVDDFVMKN